MMRTRAILKKRLTEGTAASTHRFSGCMYSSFPNGGTSFATLCSSFASRMCARMAGSEGRDLHSPYSSGATSAGHRRRRKKRLVTRRMPCVGNLPETHRCANSKVLRRALQSEVSDHT